MGLISRIGRTGDHWEEDWWPLGIGLVTAWNKTGDRLEEDGSYHGRGRLQAGGFAKGGKSGSSAV